MTTKSSNTPSAPLLSKSPEPTLAPASPFAVGLVNCLGYFRAGLGFCAILAPTTVGKIFLTPIAVHSTESTLLRLVGVRDLVIGELTWFVRPRPSHGQSERGELRRVIYANMATDTLDLACLAFAAYKGAIPRPAAGIIGGGAAAFLGMGLLALREL
jgi:hypothetical protein